MLSLTDEWDYTTRGLAAICKEGVDAIGAALKELESHGYLVRRQLRDSRGRITDTEYTIYESPHPPLPDTASPDTENPYLDIGKYGRMHREYLREVHPVRLNTLTLTGELWTYLADLNEQAQERLDTIMEQMKAAEGVTEELKRTRQMEWVQRCNNIHNRAEEIILQEMIYS